jgi:sterol desaturase/sphingolipid hydroxylase (fatty acid hydroxylase superfamily)
MVSGVIALTLGVLCLLAVLAFHFPAVLTTPQLRQVYDVALLRQILFAAMVLAGGIALFNIVMGRVRWLSAAAFALVGLSLALGGHRVPVADFPDQAPYIGLDWFVLDLLGSALIFVFIEKLFPLRREQPVFRPAWQTDFQHFVVNHLLVGFMLLATNLLVHRLFGWAAHDGLRGWVQGLPFGIALFLLVLLADGVQYAAHRAYHRWPLLWRLHAVHHSVEHMDWLAGSRQHLVEVVITRTLVLAPIVMLGFAKEVIDAYIVIVGFQAVFNHANVNVRLGPLRYLIVTPNFHHWHHAQDREAIDRNFAAHFAFIDHLFGTAVQAERHWPQRYGVVGDGVPAGFWRQLLYPFVTRPGR